jgi:hypothetical protein
VEETLEALEIVRICARQGRYTQCIIFNDALAPMKIAPLLMQPISHLPLNMGGED